MDVTKLSEMEFRVTMVKMMSRLEKIINENVTVNIESLRMEMRANLTKIKNSISQMQSKLEALGQENTGMMLVMQPNINLVNF